VRTAAERLDLGHRLLGGSTLDEREVVAAPRQLDRDRPADAAARTGD